MSDNPKTGKKADANAGKSTSGKRVVRTPGGMQRDGMGSGGLVTTSSAFDTVVVRDPKIGSQGKSMVQSQPSPQEIMRRTSELAQREAEKAAQRQRNDKFKRFLLGRKEISGPRCLPLISALQLRKTSPPIRGGAAGSWICGLPHAIKYKERKYENQLNEYRVFIEGAEVTHYVEGDLSWTVESTGGMNTARFVLNNNQDAFIITPMNICAGPYSTSAWRLSKTGNKETAVSESVYRSNYRVDEAAKWRIYKTKYEAVDPEGKGGAPQIDQFTGMWLYPLNPYSCIFDKHDTVRIFVRLPHVSAVKRRGYREWYDLWMPAFTGFIKDYTWNDDPVGGKRVVNITCYDYRGLMERMRVRTSYTGTKSGAPSVKDRSQTGKKDEKPSDQKGTDTSNVEPSHIRKNYLRWAKIVAQKVEARLRKAYPWWTKSVDNPKWFNPLVFANETFAFEFTMNHMHTLIFTQCIKLGCKNGVNGLMIKPCKGADILIGGQAVAGRNFDSQCANAAVSTADRAMADAATGIIRAVGSILTYYGFLPYQDGTIKQLRPKTKVKASGGELTFEIEEIDVTKTAKKFKEKREKGNALYLIRDLKKRFSAFDYRDKFITNVAIYFTSYKALFETFGVYGQQGSQQGLAYVQKSHIQNRRKAIWKALSDRDVPDVIDKLPVWMRRAGRANPFLSQGHKRRGFKFTDPRSNKVKSNIARLRKEISLLTIKINCFAKLSREMKTDASNYYNVPCAKRYGIKEPPKSLENFDLKLAQLEKEKETLKQRLDWNSKQDRIGVIFEQRFAEEVGWKKLFNIASNLTDEYIEKFALDAALAVREQRGISAGSLNATYKLADLGIKNRATADGVDVGKALHAYLLKLMGKIEQDIADGNFRRIRKNRAIRAINAALRRMRDLRATIERSLSERVKLSIDNPAVFNRARQFKESVRDQTAAGLASQSPGVNTMGEALIAYAHFGRKQAGIFADLVTATDRINPHPLAGKSFEQSVEYLCCEQQRIVRGVEVNIDSYRTDKTKLDGFNRTALFGVLGRPMTFAEVTEVGRGTVSALKADFSPYNVFYHLLRPARGTGAATIVQQHLGNVGTNSTSLNYKTRKALLDDICSTLDYQFYVSGYGDLVFEIPHYNAMPADFGSDFSGAYTVEKTWKNSSIAEESQEIPTAWVLEGLEPHLQIDQVTKGKAPTNKLRHIVIMAPILARRLGVRVENINLRIPGVGAPGAAGQTQALDQLQVYGLFHIQRQLGRSHILNMAIQFRPYILPNRPIHFIPRQRIGLPQSVTHTMSAPNGECTTDLNLTYTRWLFRDGTFRFIAGGERQPIDYTGFFTGLSSFQSKEGVRSGKSATKTGSGASSCTSRLANRARQASAFSASVAGTFGADFATQPPSGTKASRPQKEEKRATITNKAGIVMSETPKKDEPQGTPQNTRTDLDVSDPMKYVNSPWKYLNHKKYEAFGYFRVATRSGYRKLFRSHSKKDYMHSGLDVKTATGTHCLAPIDIDYADAGMKVGPLQGATNYGWIRADKAKNAGAFRVRNRSKIGPYYKIYVDQYLMWLGLTNNGTNPNGLRLEWYYGGTGLWIDCWGYFQLPKGGQKSGRIRCMFRYIHLNNLVRKEGKVLGKDVKEGTKGNPVFRAGDTCCYVGASGATGPHLHVNMYIAQGQAESKSDKHQTKIAIAANKYYIDSTLAMAAGMWKARGTDPKAKDKMNRRANDYWQRRLGRVLKKKNITIKDVVEYFQKRSRYQQYVGDSKVPGAAVRGTKIPLTYVNITLFFNPEQFINLKKRQHPFAYFSGKYRKFRGVAYNILHGSRYSRKTLYRNICRMELNKVVNVWNRASKDCGRRLSAWSGRRYRYRNYLKAVLSPYTSGWKDCMKGKTVTLRGKTYTALGVLAHIKGGWIRGSTPLSYIRGRARARVRAAGKRALNLEQIRATAGRTSGLGIGYIYYK